MTAPARATASKCACDGAPALAGIACACAAASSCACDGALALALSGGGAADADAASADAACHGFGCKCNAAVGGRENCCGSACAPSIAAVGGRAAGIGWSISGGLDTKPRLLCDRGAGAGDAPYPPGEDWYPYTAARRAASASAASKRSADAALGVRTFAPEGAAAGAAFFRFSAGAAAGRADGARRG